MLKICVDVTGCEICEDNIALLEIVEEAPDLPKRRVAGRGRMPVGFLLSRYEVRQLFIVPSRRARGW
jgi:hypothetical protein